MPQKVTVFCVTAPLIAAKKQADDPDCPLIAPGSSCMRATSHRENHRSHNIGWLRAAVLGANDGIISTGSLIVGIAASQAAHGTIVTTGVAALVAGAMSMAAGEFVSVSSQSDTEIADLERERQELAEDPEHELQELTAIYVARGLSPALASQVATQLMANDALGAHARDELGISEITAARPVQAALTSAATFTTGAAIPLLAALVTPAGALTTTVVAATSLLSLAVLGALAAGTGGASVMKGTLRVLFWGALSMAITAGIGTLFGAVA
jgi:VIT1/CCC1 family predicted Fe2+/Mn2+ transporter